MAASALAAPRLRNENDLPRLSPIPTQQPIKEKSGGIVSSGPSDFQPRLSADVPQGPQPLPPVEKLMNDNRMLAMALGVATAELAVQEAKDSFEKIRVAARWWTTGEQERAISGELSAVLRKAEAMKIPGQGPLFLRRFLDKLQENTGFTFAELLEKLVDDDKSETSRKEFFALVMTYGQFLNRSEGKAVWAMIEEKAKAETDEEQDKEASVSKLKSVIEVTQNVVDRTSPEAARNSGVPVMPHLPPRQQEEKTRAPQTAEI